MVLRQRHKCARLLLLHRLRHLLPKVDDSLLPIVGRVGLPCLRSGCCKFRLLLRLNAFEPLLERLATIEQSPEAHALISIGFQHAGGTFHVLFRRYRDRLLKRFNGTSGPDAVSIRRKRCAESNALLKIEFLRDANRVPQREEQPLVR